MDGNLFDKVRIVILIFVVSTSHNCKAQAFYDDSELAVELVANYVDNDAGFPEHVTYVKDINNVLNKYVGTWKGIYNSKNFEFRIVKYTTPYIDNFKEDILLMRYKITNGSSTVENTLSLGNTNNLVINGIRMTANGGYILYYSGPNSNCGQAGDIYISISSLGSNKMNLLFVPARDLLNEAECPNDINYIMPLDPIVLTKQ